MGILFPRETIQTARHIMKQELDTLPFIIQQYRFGMAGSVEYYDNSILSGKSNKKGEWKEDGREW